MKRTDAHKKMGVETGARPSRWLVDRWLPRGRAGLLIGVPGVGKGLLAVALAAGVAGDGGDWLGGAPVGELVRRVARPSASSHKLDAATAWRGRPRRGPSVRLCWAGA